MLIVVLASFVTHWILTIDTRTYFMQAMPSAAFVIFSSVLGLLLLMFPLLGWIADVCIGRYRAIHYSVSMLTMEMLLFITAISLYAFTSLQYTMRPLTTTLAVVAGMSGVITIGMFEANAVQFGMDQLLEASSSQLSAFIHFYFWSTHAGSLVSVYFFLALAEYIFAQKCRSDNLLVYIQALLATGLQVVGLSVVLLILYSAGKKHLYIERTGNNPFRNVWKVLKYAWNNTYPKRRSAFTYWEEDIPPRIDLGKAKYGGPFTTEEVEDVKTFFRLLVLIGSMFGYHVAGDGISMTQHLALYTCPSLQEFALLVHNPSHLSFVVVLIAIPLLHCLPCRLHRYAPSMLERIRMGLLVMFVQEAVYTALSLHTISKQKTNQPFVHASAVDTCYRVHHGYMDANGNCTVLGDPVDHTFLWLIVPQLLNGLGQVLVNMTALEFLCAQSPRALQGLLIGFWYATFSIKYVLIGWLDDTLQASRHYYVYRGVRTIAVLASVALFSFVVRHYKYRVRDDIVPEQWLIETVTERRMEQEEKYWARREQEEREWDRLEQEPLMNDNDSNKSYQSM